jgi:hypothetical protein
MLRQGFPEVLWRQSLRAFVAHCINYLLQDAQLDSKSVKRLFKVYYKDDVVATPGGSSPMVYWPKSPAAISADIGLDRWQKAWFLPAALGKEIGV